jgi:hypothetical protein
VWGLEDKRGLAGQIATLRIYCAGGRLEEAASLS